MSGMEPLTPTWSCLSPIYETSSSSALWGILSSWEFTVAASHLWGDNWDLCVLVTFDLMENRSCLKTYGIHHLCSLAVCCPLSDSSFHRLFPTWFHTLRSCFPAVYFSCLFLLPLFVWLLWAYKLPFCSHTHKSSKNIRYPLLFICFSVSLTQNVRDTYTKTHLQVSVL